MKKLMILMIVLTVLAAVISSAPAQNSIEFTPVPTPIVPTIEDLQTVFHLTINYKCDDGSSIAPPHSEMLEAGAHYEVASPVMADKPSNKSDVKGTMPRRNVEYTVMYVCHNSQQFENIERPLFSIEDYDTALGLGMSIMNVGVCTE